MKQTVLAVLLGAVGASALVGCGGGETEERGGATAFNIVPTSTTLTGLDVPPGSPPPTDCPTGFATRVFAYGGAGPYTVNITLPGAITVSKTLLSGPGDFFDVFVNTTGCLTNIPIVVRDQTGRQAIITVTTVPGKVAGT
jgi:hypothetical protein